MTSKRLRITGILLPALFVTSPVLSAEPPSSTAKIEYLAATPKNYSKLAAAVEATLRRDVLDAWFPRCVDQEHGGFRCNFARDWQPTRSEGKFSVFQGRMTWITSQVALRRPDFKQQFLPHAAHGAKFLQDVMWDKQDGGMFWGTDDNGKVSSAFGNDKQLYGIAFCLYAAAAAHQATGDPAALGLAQRTFRWIDEHAHDAEHGGYFEWLKRDGTPIPPNPAAKQPVLRLGFPVGGKSMNTHIHLLEAFTQLYQVWPDPTLRERLNELLLVLRDKVSREPGVMHLFFTNDWQPTSTRDSYGHDVEAAYLLLEAAEAIGTSDDQKTQQMARLLVDHPLETGWDAEFGGFYKEGPLLGQADDLLKDWWAQMEGLNALLLMHELYGEQTDRYFKAFQQQWRFIQEHQIDHQHPGVIETVRRDGTPTTQAKGRMWKAAYHDGRALLNVSERLKRLAADKTSP